MMVDSTKVKIISDDMRFRTVDVKDLSDEMVFTMIQGGFLTKGQYVQWLEGVRDGWFNIGHQSCECECVEH